MKQSMHMFCSEEHLILRQKMRTLNKLERLILSMRFWDNMMIEEIAHCLRLPWDHVNDTLESSFLKLRTELARDSRFKAARAQSMTTLKAA